MASGIQLRIKVWQIIQFTSPLAPTISNLLNHIRLKTFTENPIFWLLSWSPTSQLKTLTICCHIISRAIVPHSDFLIDPKNMSGMSTHLVTFAVRQSQLIVDQMWLKKPLSASYQLQEKNSIKESWELLRKPP